jgi:hypothetical protein
MATPCLADDYAEQSASDTARHSASHIEPSQPQLPRDDTQANLASLQALEDARQRAAHRSFYMP